MLNTLTYPTRWSRWLFLSRPRFLRPASVGLRSRARCTSTNHRPRPCQKTAGVKSRRHACNGLMAPAAAACFRVLRIAVNELPSRPRRPRSQRESPPMTVRLFEPIQIDKLKLSNRIVIAPMCQYSATTEGVMTDWHTIHLGHLALSGAGL